jgi:small ligand-binding sensory domain FIST
MKWASAISDATAAKRPLVALVKECCFQISEQLEGESPNFVVAFVAPSFIEEYDQLPQVVLDDLKAQHFIGCSAGGLIGGGIELEQKPAVAMVGAVLPDVEIKTFHMVNPDLPDADAAPDRWHELVGVTPDRDPHFVLLPDPFSFRIDALVQGLDYAFPAATKIGGLVSGARRPNQNALFIQDKLYRNGSVGAVLHGNIQVDTIVAQGCRPIGRPLRVTKCDKNIVFEIDGKTAVNALHDVVEGLSELEQSLARQSLFIGIAMNEFQINHKPGDFLVRNIIGIEPTIGALVVGEALREEQTVQFHVRDAATSADDLRMLLKQHRDLRKAEPYGALLFSCLGRGEHLYGVPNHDSQCFREYLGSVPLGGFFCNGEIGPVAGTTFLHGYTSSFGIFRAKLS